MSTDARKKSQEIENAQIPAGHVPASAFDLERDFERLPRSWSIGNRDELDVHSPVRNLGRDEWPSAGRGTGSRLSNRRPRGATGA